jgi:hypothetical protein
LHTLNYKKIDIEDVKTITVLSKQKKVINYKIIKLLFALYVLIILILYQKQNISTYIIFGMLFFILSFIYKKKIIELRIIKKDGMYINIELEKVEERKAKLFIKKVLKYKECMIDNNFYYHG